MEAIHRLSIRRMSSRRPEQLRAWYRQTEPRPGFQFRLLMRCYCWRSQTNWLKNLYEPHDRSLLVNRICETPRRDKPLRAAKPAFRDKGEAVKVPADVMCPVEGHVMAVSFILNRKHITLDVDPSEPILWAIRESAGLTGTKFGCGIAQCGACTVHLDGRPIRSCITPTSAAAGKAVTTIEGVFGPAALAVQNAWEKLDVVQCGYCQSGQIMSAIALLNEKSSPTDAEVDAAMSGNICRCGTYVRIRAAIHEAARTGTHK